MEMFDQFKHWYEERHSYARSWKARTSGKVMGCFCSYAPEEILVAANWLPARILGSHEPQDVAEKHIFGMFCPFCRDVLAQGLKGRYEYLDGILLTQSCIHLRQSFMSWKMHVPVPFQHYIYMPQKVQTPHAVPYHRSELAKFRKALEQFDGKTLSDDDLDRGIALVNENRDLMRQVYEFRKSPNPKVTGQESMWMTTSSMWVDKAEHSAEVRKVLQQLPDRQMTRETGARLMLIGSENDDIPFIELVERVGATVVQDDHCTGTRYFWNLVETHPPLSPPASGGEKGGVSQLHNDPMTAIAERYIRRPACPVKDWEERTRFDHILKLAKEWEVAGAIIIQQKFCDPHEADMVPLRAFLNDNGIPNLMLEFDATTPLGPFRIRVEAFLEMIGQEELF
jgi:benzoyl-CoA reductase subunit C